MRPPGTLAGLIAGLICCTIVATFQAYAQIPPRDTFEEYRRREADEKVFQKLKERNRLATLQYNLNAVVMLGGEVAGAEILGAGIVVGWAQEQLYVATANHLVRRGSASARNLRVTFERRRGNSPRVPRAATLLGVFDPELDLAVLAVPGVSRQQYDVCSELGVLPLRTLDDGKSVLPVGNPNGHAWVLPSIPDAIVKFEYPRIYFQSQVLSRGHSGGGLLYTSGAVAGMIVQESPPFGVALSIHEIRVKLHRWQIPEQIRNQGDCNLNQHYDLVRQSEKAAAAGDAAAMERIGLAYAVGQGAAQDDVLAVEWLEKAVAAGSTRAMNHLGGLFAGLHKYDKAREWYEKAVAGGFAAALTNLGIMYEQARGTTRDYNRARQWYEKAAAAGRPVAMYNLGHMYEQGRGVAKDIVAARQWYEKASAAGYQRAADRLKTLPR